MEKLSFFPCKLISVNWAVEKHPKCTFLAAIYLLKVSKGNTRTMYEFCSKLTIKAIERCH